MTPEGGFTEGFISAKRREGGMHSNYEGFLMGLGKLFEHPLSLAVVVLLIVLLLGWKRLPDMARSLGRSSRILKSEIDEMKTESNRSKASTTTVEGETTNPVHDAAGNPVHSGDNVAPATRAEARRTDV